MRLKCVIYAEKVKSRRFFAMVLDRIGLNKKYTGYYYLVQMLELAVNQNMDTRCYYKTAYPMLSEFFNVSELTIERNIRHLLKRCWNEKMAEKLKPFWNKPTRPTCKKFLAATKSYIIHLLTADE